MLKSKLIQKEFFRRINQSQVFVGLISFKSFSLAIKFEALFVVSNSFYNVTIFVVFLNVNKQTVFR